MIDAYSPILTADDAEYPLRLNIDYPGSYYLVAKRVVIDRWLLGLDFDLLLLAHGDLLAGGAKEALRRFATSAD